MLALSSRSFKLFAGLAFILVAALQTHADTVFAPSDAASVIGVTIVGANAIVSNNSPGSEGPSHAVDGLSAKYLNFDKLNTGFLLTPGGGAKAATSIQLWTANDAVERDPASFQLYGTNSLPASGPYPLAGFTLVASGPLALPAGRNTVSLSDALSQTVSFANSTSYSTYMVIFPTVKLSDAANSMQIGEVQLFSTATTAAVPLPSSALAGAALLVALAATQYLRRRTTAN